MKILVTGGCGFIGCNFIKHVMKTMDAQIINIDKLTYSGLRENLSDIEGNDRYTFIQGDICDKDSVKNAMSDCDYVVHFAAASHVDKSINDSTEFTQTNVFGTHVLLEEARKHDIKKFVMISTDEVYGQIIEGKFTEMSLLNPRNPYAATKAAADRLAYSFFITHKLPVVITRSSNNFGPHQFPEKLVSLSITNVLQNKKIPVYGNGNQIRDWLYVQDNCEAIKLCMQYGKIGEVYNIGGNNEVKNIDIVKKILRHLGKEEDMINHVKDRPGHDKRYSLDTTKIQNTLGWTIKHDFNFAFTNTINWYKENQNWWKKIVA